MSLRAYLEHPRAWPALFVAPIAFAIDLGISYPLVPLVCANQNHGLMHVVHVIFLVITLTGVWYGARLWRMHPAPRKSDAGSRAAQQHFLGIVGTFVSAIAALAVFAQWFTTFVVPPCVS